MLPIFDCYVHRHEKSDLDSVTTQAPITLLVWLVICETVLYYSYPMEI